MTKKRTGVTRRTARHLRVRRKVVGSSERPRVSVFRSLQNIYVQLIDDTQGSTLASASSLENTITGAKGSSLKIDVSKRVGSLIAKRAVEKGISAVVFDRGGYKYHGRVKALAEAAREGGLKF